MSFKFDPKLLFYIYNFNIYKLDSWLKHKFKYLKFYLFYPMLLFSKCKSNLFNFGNLKISIKSIRSSS